MEQRVSMRYEQDRRPLKGFIESVGETEIVKAVRAYALKVMLTLLVDRVSSAGQVGSQAIEPVFSARQGRRTAPPSDPPYPAAPAHPRPSEIVNRRNHRSSVNES